jgi:NAD(P)H-flavin reductase
MAKATYQARVVANRLVTRKIFETVLELVDPPEFEFKAGQFVTVPVGEKLLRSYSIACPPRSPKLLEFIVDVSPGGPGSIFFEHLREGDAVSFQGPYGAFWLRPDTQEELLFIATGTGIAPIRGMILDIFDRGGQDRPMSLHYGVRHRDELIYHEELLELAEGNPKFTYYPTISQPEPGTWDGMVGRCTAHLPHYVTSVEGVTAFVCGSKNMLKDVSEILMGKGMERKHIKKEQFY